MFHTIILLLLLLLLLFVLCQCYVRKCLQLYGVAMTQPTACIHSTCQLLTRNSVLGVVVLCGGMVVLGLGLGVGNTEVKEVVYGSLVVELKVS